MTEKQKRDAGQIYNPNYDEELGLELVSCKDKCHKYNQLLLADSDGRKKLIDEILGAHGQNTTILSPFWCDYGYNVEVGENFFANHNCVILDGAKVRFGDNVFIAPNCSFYTAGHPVSVTERNEGLEYAYPIIVGNNVWIGGNVTVLPGVTIGDNVVIGAGSVVTKDIPSGVMAFGNPCKVYRELTEEEMK